MLNIQDLPNELVLKILDYSETNDIINCGQVSKRIRKISRDGKLWVTVNLKNKIVKSELLEMILNKGCTILNMYRSTIVGSLNSSIKSKLRVLDLSQPANMETSWPGFCKKNITVLEQLMRSCCSLQHLNLQGLFLTPKIARSICKNGKTLQELNLNRSPVSGYLMPNGDFQAIIKCCQELKEVHLANDKKEHALTAEDLQFLAKNISPNVLKLTLTFQYFTDDHVKILLGRCREIKELILEATLITKFSLKIIIKYLSLSLEELTMNYRVGSKPSFLELKSMPRLKFLYLHSLTLNADEIQSLRQELPHLKISTYLYG